MNSTHLHNLDFTDRPIGGGSYKRARPFTLPKGGQFQVIVVPPDTIIAPHVHHETTEVFVVVKGSGTVNAEAVEVGDSILIERNDWHSIRTFDDSLTLAISKWDDGGVNDIFFDEPAEEFDEYDEYHSLLEER